MTDEQLDYYTDLLAEGWSPYEAREIAKHMPPPPPTVCPNKRCKQGSSGRTLQVQLRE